MDWIKLKCNFLQNDKIRLIRAEKNGDAMAFLWVGLLCLAGGQENGGVFKLNGQILSDRALALLLDVSPKLMSRALALFSSFGMVAKDDGAYVLPGWEAHQSTAALEERRRRNRERQAACRARKKESPVTGSVTALSQENPRPEKEKEKEREKDSLPPTPLGGGSERPFAEKEESEDFVRFWEAYPKQEGRPAAWREWRRLSPSEELLNRILSGVKRRQKTDEWQRDGGRFIPRPARYLAERRWEDEVKNNSGFNANKAFGQVGEKSYDLDKAFGQVGEKSYDLDKAFERAVARQRKGL